MFRNFFYFFVLTTCCAFASDLSHLPEGFSYKQRPVSTIEKIDACFNNLQESGRSWPEGGTYLINLNNFLHEEYLKKLCLNAPSGSTVNYLDLGAGDFGGGARVAFKFMSDNALIEHMQKNRITLVLVGLSGEKYDIENNISHKDGLIIEKRYGSIKIENLEQELERLDLSEKFDVIFSRWTLIHLVDPLGTYQQALDSLSLNGLFIYTGFFMQFPQMQCSQNPRLTFLDQITLATYAGKFIQNPSDSSHTKNFEFVLKKTCSKPLPFKYNGDPFEASHEVGFFKLVSNYSCFHQERPYDLPHPRELPQEGWQYYGDSELFNDLLEFLPKENEDCGEHAAEFLDLYKRK